jgi:hypothetical protein
MVRPTAGILGRFRWSDTRSASLQQATRSWHGPAERSSARRQAPDHATHGGGRGRRSSGHRQVPDDAAGDARLTRCRRTSVIARREAGSARASTARSAPTARTLGSDRTTHVSGVTSRRAAGRSSVGPVVPDAVLADDGAGAGSGGARQGIVHPAATSQPPGRGGSNRRAGSIAAGCQPPNSGGWSDPPDAPGTLLLDRHGRETAASPARTAVDVSAPHVTAGSLRVDRGRHPPAQR